MVGRARRLGSLRAAERRLAIEALLGCARARVAVALCRFPRLARGFGRPVPAEPGVDAPAVTPSDAESALVGEIGRIVRKICRHTPWSSLCLVQAITAQRMLRRRGIASRLTIGVARDDARLRAHAWLTAAGRLVTGGRESAAFRPIASYEDTPAGRGP